MGVACQPFPAEQKSDGLSPAHPIDFCGHNKVALGEPIDFVGPESDFSFSPRQENIRMVAFVFGHFANSIYKFQRLLEIGEAKLPVDVVLVGDRPLGNTLVKLFEFISSNGRRAPAAGHAFFVR